MITWKKNLYLGEEAGKESRKILSKIRRHQLQLGVYVIVLSVNGKDILDIIPANMLSADNYKGFDICILGLAVGKAEAWKLAERMILEAVCAGAEDIRGYFA